MAPDIYDLIIEALEERAQYRDEHAERARRAAARIRDGLEDDIWDVYIGPMLDAMERGLGS